jgi:hypothetical protein
MRLGRCSRLMMKVLTCQCKEINPEDVRREDPLKKECGDQFTLTIPSNSSHTDFYSKD